MSAEGWVLIIGAVFVGLTNLVSLVLQYLAERRKQQRDQLHGEIITDTNKTVHKISNGH